MTPRQLDILQHCLGADKHGHRTGNRNCFCAGPEDEPTCRELVALGYMREHARTTMYPYYNVSATQEGMTAMKEHSEPEPKLTASQQRYRRFLMHDSGLKFRVWLKHYGSESTR